MNKFLIITIFIIIIFYIVLFNYANDIDVYVYDTNKKGKTILLIGSVHGNEPAGHIALSQLKNDLDNNKLKIKNGKVIIIDTPNKLGLMMNNRLLLHRFWNTDLNRNFPNEYSNEALEPISEIITEYVKNADWIIDFHEGWGYLSDNNGSLGSGIYSSNTEESKNMVNELLNEVNSIRCNSKKFTTIENLDIYSNEIGTLRNYCVQLNKNYILVETTGQNEIIPLEIRAIQVRKIIDYIMLKLEIIK